MEGQFLTLRPRDIAAQIADLLHEYLTDGKPDPEIRLHARLLALASMLKPAVAECTERPEPKVVSQEREIFLHWQRVLDKPRSKLTPERRTRVRARLRDGYTVEDIKKAIDAVASSDWHRGSNNADREFTDLVLICQNGSKLESYIDLWDRENGVVSSRSRVRVDEERTQPHLPGLIELEKTASELLRRGDTDAYNDTQRQMRAMRGKGDR